MELKNGILLFDGFCVLCSYFVRKLVKRYGKRLELIPAQTEQGAFILKSNGLPVVMPNEVLLITGNGVFSGMDAIIILMRNGAGWWRFLGALLSLLPNRISSWLYRLVARNRYWWFGKRKTCYLG